MSFIEATYAAMSVLLVVAGGTLVFTAARGFQAVVYRRAVLTLGASVVLFVVGWLVQDLQYFGLVDSELPYLVAFVVLTVAAALHFVAIWLFARDFVQFGADTVTIETSGAEGGFADDAE